MKTRDVLNAKVLKVWTKGSLVVVGLFVVLYCGVAAFALRSCTKIVDDKIVYYKFVDGKYIYNIVDKNTVNGNSICYKTVNDQTFEINCDKTDNGKIVCYKIIDEGNTYNIVDDRTIDGNVTCTKTGNDKTVGIICTKTVDDKTVCYKFVNNKPGDNSVSLILILVIPVIVFLIIFLIFFCLVIFHYVKLFEFSKIKEENRIKTHKMEMTREVCIMVTKILKSDSIIDWGKFKEIVEKILEKYPQILS